MTRRFATQRARGMRAWQAFVALCACVLVSACAEGKPAPDAPTPPDSAVPDATVTNDASLPADPSDPPEIRRNLIAVGRAHTCLLRNDGTPVCWGAGGPNDPIDEHPHYGQSIAPDGDHFTQIVAGDDHTCAMREDGTIRCWGEVSAIEGTPTGSFEWITAHSGGTCVLDASGTRTCWGTAFVADVGDRRYAELAIGGGGSQCGVLLSGETDCWFGDQPALDAPQGVHHMTGMASCFCGIDSTAHALCWGWNCYDVQPGRERVVQIAHGVSSVCGITEARGVTCWGAFDSPAIDGTAVSLAGGPTHGCARTQQGRARCWGRDRNGATQPPPELLD